MAKISRKNFITKMAGATAAGVFMPTLIPSSALGKAGTVAPSNRINIAFIGHGCQSGGHRGDMARNPNTQILAVCDVKLDVLDKVYNEVEGINKGRGIANSLQKTIHYQECLDRDDIDAAFVVTPDHWHVGISLYAILRGKHVYCEKPLTLTVREGRILADAAKKANVRFQTGSQQRSENGFRKAAELVRNGAIGKLKEVYISIGNFPPPLELPETPFPDTFPAYNYDLWLGPTPWRPYHPERVKGDYGGGWRRFWEYGARKEGDWGAHHFDIVQWAMGKDNSGPTKFCPKGTDGVPCRFYQYEKEGVTVFVNPEGNMGQCQFKNKDGVQYKGGGTRGEAIRFVGDAGEVQTNRGDVVKCLPDESLARLALKSGTTRLHPSMSHRQDWIEAIKTGRDTICPAEVGHRTASICHLSAIALRTNRVIHWDPKKEEIIGDPAASAMLDRPRRAPYYLGA